jgi:hypothetical protein
MSVDTLDGEDIADLPKGMDAWAVADEEVVLAKIKQSLRGKVHKNPVMTWAISGPICESNFSNDLIR